MSVVAKRYAKAAVEACLKGLPEIEALSHDLKAFGEVLKSSLELKEVLFNPGFRSERNDILTAVLVRAEVSSMAQKLLLLLAERDRLGLLPDVVSEVESLANDYAHRLVAKVESAVPLEKPQTERLAAVLERRLGRKIVVESKLNPEILGGLVCTVGDLTFDFSLRQQLEEMRNQLVA